MTDDCNQGDFTAGSDDPTGPMPEQSAETGPGGAVRRLIRQGRTESTRSGAVGSGWC